MKEYVVELRSENSVFRSEFASTNARLALNAAMKAAEVAYFHLTPYVRVLDAKGNLVWDSQNQHIILPL